MILVINCLVSILYRDFRFNKKSLVFFSPPHRRSHRIFCVFVFADHTLNKYFHPEYLLTGFITTIKSTTWSVPDGDGSMQV